MTVFNVLFGIAAGILFFGVIGEQDKAKHKDITKAFIAVVLAIVLLNLSNILA